MQSRTPTGDADVFFAVFLMNFEHSLAGKKLATVFSLFVHKIAEL